MRRGGRGCHLQAPWRRRDDPTLSSIPCGQSKAHTFRLLTALAAFSLAISIIIWNSQRHDLQSRKPGFVFPLYHYYRQAPNASNDLSSAANGRGLRKVSPPFLKLREDFYVEMRLGVHAKKFNFHVDTGSKQSWVYCKIRGHRSKLTNLGPNGMFKPRRESMVKCRGKDSKLCHEIQDADQDEPCDRDHNFECLLLLRYRDTSRYKGVFVIESLTLPTRDNGKVKGHGLFGCVTQKRFHGENLPLLHDGLIGLGNCEMTLVDQWTQQKLISQNVVGICIAKAVRPELFGTRTRMGYISVGVDFNEKFGQSNLAWAKLKEDDECAIIVALSYIIFEDKKMKPLDYPWNIDALLVLDTGSDLTHLDIVLYDLLIDALDLYAQNRGYNGITVDLGFQDSDQGKCWNVPKDITISPIHNFPLLTFAIQGMTSDSKDDQIQYLTLQPQNYLEWEAHEKRLCVNIVCTSDLESKTSALGAAQLREHLFVIDFDNQRVGWQPNACVL